MANNKMTTCKHCGAEIAASAKTCPHCGGKNKKPIYKRVWFWALIVVLVLGIGAAGGSGKDDSSTGPSSGSAAGGKEEAPIEYTEVTTDELADALEANAVNASEAYKGKYLAVTGKLDTIDSDGNYINLDTVHNTWDIYVVTCRIKTDDQLDKVRSLKKGDTITVKGKITDVGEYLKYDMDIDEIA